MWLKLCTVLGLIGQISMQLQHGLFTRNLREGHVTVPSLVDHTGKHLSFNLTSHHDDDFKKRVFFKINFAKMEHFVELRPNRHRLLSPGLIVEHHRKHNRTRHPPSYKSTSCHFQGVVQGQPKSRVALSTCHGLVGIIHFPNEKYYIEPMSIQQDLSKEHKHLIFKRSALQTTSKKKARKKKRKKHHSNCGTRDPKKLTELEWQRHLGRIKVQEKRMYKPKIKFSNLEFDQMKKMRYKNTPRIKRSISKPQFVETLLVADSSMVEFHQEGDIETYILTIMNMVSSFYLDPSIGNFIRVVVVKIILIDEALAQPELNVTVNADTTLKNFCKWQKGLNPGNDSHPHHHDVAILITRQDICARQDTPCGTLGMAHIGGMCKAGKSCSVNEDNGITSAHTIAHEMGHNFGMLHDTEKTGCKRRQGGALHIMTPSFEADSVSVSWSNCSRREITSFLDKGMGECLQDEPQELEEYEYPELPAGAMYNADHQCRFQFGAEATVCSPMDDICNRLWCSINETCTTLLRPAAPGTNCGKHKWCQNQRCVPMMEPPVAIDGGWGEWSPWSPCSRSCGAGVSIMQRHCDHPAPAAGGRFCVGQRRRYRICNTTPCPGNTPTFRASQCSHYNNQTHDGHLYKWQPFFDQAQPCQLFCTDANETVIVPWGEYAADGTSCSVISRDICISGICKKVGCDWVVDSTAVEDDCGICNGDGTKCDKVEGIYTKQSNSLGYREVVVVPPGARNIRIDELGNSDNYISIGSALENKFYLNGKRHITLPGEYTIGGAQALYERHEQREKLRIPGPTTEPIVIYIYFRGKVHNPGVAYQYSIWKPPIMKQVKFSWILDDWSQCSATCGGGIQHRKPQCQESIVSISGYELNRPTIVDSNKCLTRDKPSQLMRTCNDDPCPYFWWVGPWQSCPVTCAQEHEKPVLRRSVMCVDGQVMALPDQYCDKNAKPVQFKRCKALPKCESEEVLK